MRKALAAKIVKPTFTCPIDPDRAANLILKHFELRHRLGDRAAIATLQI